MIQDGSMIRFPFHANQVTGSGATAGGRRQLRVSSGSLSTLMGREVWRETRAAGQGARLGGFARAGVQTYEKL